jgi:hypothetical protein
MARFLVMPDIRRGDANDDVIFDGNRQFMVEAETVEEAQDKVCDFFTDSIDRGFARRCGEEGTITLFESMRDDARRLMAQAEADVDPNPVLRFMLKENVPLTRENYLQIAYLGDPPELDAEQEANLPEVFHRSGSNPTRRDRSARRTVRMPSSAIQRKATASWSRTRRRERF